LPNICLGIITFEALISTPPQTILFLGIEFRNKKQDLEGKVYETLLSQVNQLSI